MPSPTRLVGVALLAAAVAVAGTTVYRSSDEVATPPVYSDRQMLNGLWQRYTQTYIDPVTGRVLDRQQGDITTSEGQSYAMLRAVWQDDRATFDKVWEFTRTALDRPDDDLFAWRYGQRADGSYGVLVDQGGMNTASDADSDIALALVMAYGRWQQSSYLQQAHPIITDIWEHEVVEVAGEPVLTLGTSEQASPDVLVNPSYLSPYAYRVFAEVDTRHDWSAMVTSSYDLIDRVVEAPLDRATSAGLPPNWVRLDRETGAFEPLPADLTTDFGYDALRLPWRLALDAVWNGEDRATEALEDLDFLSDQWRDTSRIAATYAHDGSEAAPYESPAMYAGALSSFTITDPAASDRLYTSKLAALYDPDTQAWRTPLSYYDDNWAWFGVALHQRALPDLTKEIEL